MGCGPTAAPKPVQPKLKPLSLRPIQDLVVAAGLSWMVICRPQAFLRHKALSPALTRLVPPLRRSAFKKLSAIDIDAMRELAVAGYEDSTLFVVDGVQDVLEAERRFRERPLVDVVRRSYRRDAVWTRGRTVTGTERSISTLEPGVVAIEVAGGLRAKVALLYALGRLRKTPRALALSDMQQVFDLLDDAPLRAVAPGPFSGKLGETLNGMLSVCTAVGGSVRVHQQGQLQLAILFAGAWQDDAVRAAHYLRSGWHDVVTSSLGRLLHLDEPIDGPRVIAQPHVVGLEVRVDGVKLLEGLCDIVAGELKEIMELEAWA